MLLYALKFSMTQTVKCINITALVMFMLYPQLDESRCVLEVHDMSSFLRTQFVAFNAPGIYAYRKLWFTINCQLLQLILQVSLYNSHCIYKRVKVNTLQEIHDCTIVMIVRILTKHYANGMHIKWSIAIMYNYTVIVVGELH